jgi:hypothetical protein
MRRVWAPKGRQRPLALVRQRHEWLYVFGFVRPRTGENQWFIPGGVSTEAMSAVLAEFARLVGTGTRKQILLLPDGAGWHLAKALEIPEGIQPPPAARLQARSCSLPSACGQHCAKSVANESFEMLSALEKRLQERCHQLHSQRAYLHNLTHYHWWPE